MVVARWRDGEAVCGWRKCRVWLGDEARELIARGGRVICHECALELQLRMPEAMERANPNELYGPTHRYD
jgi:hypothetical protein